MRRPRTSTGRRRRAVVVAVALVGLLALIVVVDAVALLARVGDFPLTPAASAAGGTTYALVGSDARDFVRTEADRTRFGDGSDTPGARADVLLLLRVDDAGAVRLLEVGRDLLVVDRDRHVGRLGLSYQAGPQRLVDDVCASLGLGIDHVVVVGFDGLRDVVDAVGGVAVEVPREVRDRDSGLHLPAGRSLLDGNRTIAYVGARHLEERTVTGWAADPAAETDRAGRAVEVLHRLAAAGPQGPADVLLAQRVAWAASGSVTVDAGLSWTGLAELAGALSEVVDARVLRLPVRTRAGTIPIDELADGAGAVLDRFEGGRRAGPACRRPLLPAARR